MTAEEYYELIRPYQDALQILMTRLDVMNHSIYSSSGNPVHTVQERIKEKKSIEEKLACLSLPDGLEDAKDNLRDIAGIRVICYFVQDIYNLVETLKKQTDLIPIKESDYIANPKPNGYRSYHIVLGVPVCCLDATEYFPVEIQFRTMSMDFWASMEHRICYKKNRKNKQQLSRELLEYAEILERLEHNFEQHNETLKNQ